MLQFILGTNGTGKTTYIYKEIENLIKNCNSKIIMLVPDQISFETEKDFLEILGAKNSKKVKVFGFSRFCSYIFNLTANTAQNVMDNGTREVIMNITLEQLTEKLTLLKSKNSKSNTALMLGVLSDCKKNNISTDMLRNVSAKMEDETLKTKLLESALVLDTYNSIVTQSYVDPLDDLTRLYEILVSNPSLMQGHYLYIDSFSDFTSQQIKVLRLLMARCSKTTIALTLDPNSDDEIFAVSQHTYNQIKRLANQDFIEIKPPVKLDDNYKFSNDELALLEKNLYRSDFEVSHSEPKNIAIYSATDTYDECEFAARQIKKQIINNGRLYSDFMIVCHDMADYNGILNVVLDKYEIPYFMDDYRDIEVMPEVRLINSIFRIIIDNYNSEDVISLLKTGLTSISQDEISAFENYCFVWNINNSRFKTEFTQNPRGFADKITEDDKNNLLTAEKVRRSIVEPLEKFRQNIKDKTGSEISTLLYNLLCELDSPNALRALYDRFEAMGQSALGEEQLRIWDLVMDAIDKTVTVTADMVLSPKRYFELLSIQISSIEFSQIPQTLDSVIVTTSQRVRASNNKISFLLGCIDGKFPAYPTSRSFFTDTEMKLLSLNDVDLGVDSGYLAQLDVFQAYCCVTSPSEMLFVSYPNVNESGERHSPSTIVTDIAKIFPCLTATSRIDYDAYEASMLAVLPAFEAFATSLSNQNEELQGLKSYFLSNPDFSSKTNSVIRSLDKTPFKIENPENSKKLFGDNLSVSASQIEKYSLCRFSYFCNYGLNIRERRKAEINPLEYGNLVHYVLEKFFNKYSKKEYSVMNKSDLSEFAEFAISEYLDSHFGGATDKSEAFIYRLKVVSENIVLLLQNIISELSQSEFYVSDCELNIGSNEVPAYTVVLPTGEKIAVRGKIDRVDVMECDGEKYIRIVDYKTEEKSFKLSEVLYGLNLQMLLYLYALEQNGKSKFGEFTPSAILYKPATVKPVSESGTAMPAEDAIKKKVNKSLQMNGLLLDDLKVLKGMEHNLGGVYIPVSMQKSGKISSGSLATLAQFGAIFKKIDTIIMSMGNDIYSGKINALPISDGKEKPNLDSCRFCGYSSVCEYRKEQNRLAVTLDNKKVFEELEKEKEEAWQ